MQRVFDKGVLAVLGLLLALIIANGVVEYHNVRQLQEARQKVEESERAQAVLQRALAVLQDAETGVRGYVITGDATYLEPYQTALAEADARFGDLDRALDKMGRRDGMPELRVRAKEVMDKLGSILAARQAGGFYSAREVVRAGGAKEAMDRVRDQVETMRREESLILQRRADASMHSVAIAQGAAVFAAAVGVLLIAALYWQMRRNLQLRDATAAELAGKEKLLRTTLANLGDAVVTCDAAGRVTYINATAAALTGWTMEAAHGQPIADIVRLVDADSHASLENAAERALRDGIPTRSRHRGRLVARGTGDERPIDESAEPIRDAEGEIAGAVLVFRDVTERRRWEDAMVEADRRKDEFLAVLAHELRNPLAPLRNALQVVRVTGNDPATLDRMWAMMDRQLRQMVRLIDDLLDVSRITRNKLELRREPVTLAAIVQDALEMSGPAIARFEHKVECDLPADLPLINGDHARLVQVLDNLLTNAAKYSEPRGTITVTGRAVDGQVSLRVRDRGLGIPPEMLERIFEMFTQVERTLHHARGGLGIGLTLVKRIVELHGGRIVARSAGAGQGSEFEVVLPTFAAANGPQAHEEKLHA